MQQRLWPQGTGGSNPLAHPYLQVLGGFFTRNCCDESFPSCVCPCRSPSPLHTQRGPSRLATPSLTMV
jgi:hypothetical protein